MVGLDRLKSFFQPKQLLESIPQNGIRLWGPLGFIAGSRRLCTGWLEGPRCPRGHCSQAAAARGAGLVCAALAGMGLFLAASRFLWLLPTRLVASTNSTSLMHCDRQGARLGESSAGLSLPRERLSSPSNPSCYASTISFGVGEAIRRPSQDPVYDRADLKAQRSPSPSFPSVKNDNHHFPAC